LKSRRGVSEVVAAVLVFVVVMLINMVVVMNILSTRYLYEPPSTVILVEEPTLSLDNGALKTTVLLRNVGAFSLQPTLVNATFLFPAGNAVFITCTVSGANLSTIDPGETRAYTLDCGPASNYVSHPYTVADLLEDSIFVSAQYILAKPGPPPSSGPSCTPTSCGVVCCLPPNVYPCCSVTIQ